MYSTDHANTNPYRKRLRRALWALGLAVLALILWGHSPAQGQMVQDARETVSEHAQFTPRVSMAIWPEAHQNYQHLYEVGARASAWWGPVQLHGYATGRFWQTDDSKVVGSPVNAENNMNNVVRYGGSFRLYYKGVFAGPAIHRTEFHVVWRHKFSNGYVQGFGTPANDWRGQAEKCQAGNGCASIAYQDAVGGVVGYEGDHFYAEAKYLPHRWKDLTYIPVPMRGRVIFQTPDSWGIGDWEAQVNAQKNILDQWRGDVRLRHRVTGDFWAVARIGRHQPDQKEAFERMAIGFLIR